VETPNYFNYGFKKSFIEHPSTQQEVLGRIPPSYAPEPQTFRFKKRRKTHGQILIQPEWDKSSHVVESRNNKVKHEQYKEFFDKDKGA
jgi:hypothetical protein